MSAMNDEQLIGYCAIHCETPRALFIGRHINRMCELAGVATRVGDEEWHSVHEDMAELCRLAQVRLRRSKLHLVTSE